MRLMRASANGERAKGRFGTPLAPKLDYNRQYFLPSDVEIRNDTEALFHDIRQASHSYIATPRDPPTSTQLCLQENR